jgi:hypothetical protein
MSSLYGPVRLEGVLHSSGGGGSVAGSRPSPATRPSAAGGCRHACYTAPVRPGLAAEGAVTTLGVAGVAGYAHRASVVAGVVGEGGALRTSQTVATQLAGKRSFIPSNAITETIKTGARVGDPEGAPGHFMYSTRVGSATGRGILEVLVDEVRSVINHVLYKSAP